MTVVVDTTILLLMLDPASADATGVDRAQERVEFLIETLAANRTEIIIPAPVIAELVAGRVHRAQAIVAALGSNRFVLQPFDVTIAIETGLLIDRFRRERPLDDRFPNWKHEMKYDAMIAATAVVRGARALYTNDGRFQDYLTASEVEVVMLSALPLRPADPQMRLPHVPFDG